MRVSNGGLLKLFFSNLIIAGLIICAGAVGWVSNLVKLTKCDFQPSYKAEVIRGTGVLLFPMGAIVGYFDIKDGGKDQ